jgi:MoxR-like ATPase
VVTGVLGRVAALAEVSGFVDALATGPAALLVEGDAGIGKTTLWRAAADAAAARGCRVISATPVRGRGRPAVRRAA